MKRFLKILGLVLVAVIGMVGYEYLSWVKNWKGASDPFDEVGIDLHYYMPGFVQDWGCAQLKAEFGDKTLPPHGCQAASGRGWQYSARRSGGFAPAPPGYLGQDE